MGWWTAGPSSVEQATTAARSAAIERKLDAIMRHLGIEDTEPSHPEVMELIRQGKTIQAIKLYRQQTGLGLAAAKHDVDRMVERSFEG